MLITRSPTHLGWAIVEICRTQRAAAWTDLHGFARRQLRQVVVGDQVTIVALRETVHRQELLAGRGTDECEVTVEIERSGDVVEIAVADNGPGIPPDEVRAIRSKRETPLVRASSIGLWLESWLTHLTDGTVAFETEDASGTTVAFEFPPATGTRSNCRRKLRPVANPRKC